MTSDPSIILFGKKIGLPEPSFSSAAYSEERQSREEAIAVERLDEHTVFTPHDQRKDEGKPDDESNDNPKTPSIDEEGLSENPTETGTGALKKPDKILPCPRCESMNTKFCYYNNSNINQPRHFCKSCQRYWTAGGTMRNMPVGAGRRKKKVTPSQCGFIITQEAFESATAANQIQFAADGVHPPKVLSFGPNPTHFVANLSGRESGNDCLATSNSVVEKIPQQDNNGFQSQVHWIPGGSWPYNNSWNTMIPMPIPPIGYPPMPIYPSPYWSSVSWLPPTVPILGKHSRDGEAIRPNGSETEPKQQRNSVLTPKTLRIDDPDEAAKSSIWATLGIKNENASKGNIFKAFQTKGEEKKKQTATELCPALQANPAAFSRSLCFQERA